jgi:hypothetical protein
MRLSIKIIFAICFLLSFFALGASAGATELRNTPYNSYLKKGIDKSFNLEKDSAYRYLKMATQLEPDNPTGYAYMAMLHLFSYEMSFNLDERKKDQEAILYYVNEAMLRGEKKIVQNPKDGQAFLAMALAKTAKVRWAIINKSYLLVARETSTIWDYLEKAKAVDPYNHDIAFLMGFLRYHVDHLPGLTRFLSSMLIISGDRQKGLHELQLAAQNGYFLQDIARIELSSDYLYFEKQPDLALPILRSLKRKFPNNYNLSFSLAFALAELHKFEEAFALAAELGGKIQAAQPPFAPQLQPRYDQLMGRIFFIQKEYAKAAQYFGRTLQDKSFYNARTRTRSLVYLGNIADTRKDRKEAEAYYSQALKVEGGEGAAQIAAKGYLETPYTPQ